MELVYLWVGKYKNIENQGFNFSPRFTCKYDEASKELTIDENKEHVSIFPENINVTAIVGENGSGKSSIIKVLKKILDYIPYTELGYTNSRQKYPYNFILVVNIDDERQYISSFDFKSENIKKVNILGHYNYYKYLAEEQQPSNDEYKTSEIIAHRFSIDKNVIANMLTSQYVSKINFKLTTFMFLPTKIEIKPLSLHSLFAELTDEYQQGYGVSVDLNENMTDREEDKAYKDARNQSWATKDDLDSIFENTDDDFHRFLIIWYIREYGDDNYYEFRDKNFLLQEYNELQDSITEDEFNQYLIEGIKGIDGFSKKEKEIYFKHFSYLFEFDFIDSENRKFNDLSHGEQTIFSQFLNIYYFSLHDKEKTFIYLMDEPDLSLHPQWQKKYLYELYNLLHKIDMTYHVVITTHSPFILSDLPKENVIFLEKGKQVDVHIDTFGANIHTLLSHGFFMKDGLMGEFAKGKIEDVINYLNDKESTIKDNDEAQKLLNIIGEPIIKNQLQRMLDSKRLSKIDKIDLIEKQIKELQEELKKVKR
ncbi:MAG: hypothetical protein QG634_434 [Patescibacteria group bacterium]|nr:hypothetical protein [Patescibacteria group bacterium]